MTASADQVNLFVCAEKQGIPVAQMLMGFPRPVF